MNNRRTIVALLATIAVLLALNLVKGERRAEAGVQRAAELDAQPGGGDPYVVKYLPYGDRAFQRVWSDGQVDRWERPFGGNCDFTFETVVVGPVDHPFPVVAAALQDSGRAVVIGSAGGPADDAEAADAAANAPPTAEDRP